MDQNNLEYRSLQLNPNNDEYWKSRGYPERPPNWQELIKNSDSDSEASDEYDESDENNENYTSGSDEDYSDSDSGSSTSSTEYDRRDREKRSTQLNPNNPAYWKARGYPGRPDNWESLIHRMF